MTIEQLLGQALEFHQSGRLADAEALYRQILESDPNQADALHRLGLLENKKGQFDVAEELIRKAMAINPQSADFAIDLGVVLSARGRFEEAVEANRRALSLKTDSAEAHFNLATALSRLSRFEEAIPIYHKALALRPNYPDCLVNLGFALTALGKPEVSLDSCRQILEIRPDFAEAHFHRANVLGQLNRNGEAMASIRLALRYKPDFPEALNVLGVLLLELNQYEEAEQVLRKATTLKPDFFDAVLNHGTALLMLRRASEALADFTKSRALQPDNAIVYYNAGNALKDLRRTMQAIDAYRKALELKPDYVKAANNLGLMLSRIGRHEEAEEAYRRALASDPNCAEAFNNLAKTFQDQGRLEQAVEILPRAIAINPEYASACNNLGIVLTEMCQIEKGLEDFRLAMNLDPNNAVFHGNLIFTLNYLYGNDGPRLLNEARQWNLRFGEPLRDGVVSHVNSRDPERKLRVGYISYDFRDHAVSRFLFRLFKNHDRKNFEIGCYSDVLIPDRVTESLRSCVDGWHDIVGVPDADVAELIRSHGVDILVDLCGHTTGSRLLVFARKPAPIQIAYLGHPGTTGLPAIDYRLTDAVADPPGMTDAFYSETLIRLARTNWCYAPPYDLPEVAPSPVSLGQPICFGSFNKLGKAAPPTLDMWAKILLEVAGSRLFLKDRALADKKTREWILREFEKRGISVDRLELAQFEKLATSHFNAYSKIDVALDTFPYNGTTTTCEALSMGVPVVTLAGKTHVSRVGASLMTSVGLADLVANSPEEYVSIAVGLARNRARIIEIRGSLREKMLASPLTDGPQFARDIESAYRTAWRRWCAAGPV